MTTSNGVLVPVTVPCDCPEQFRHPDGDVVSLFPKLGMEAGLAAQIAINQNQGRGEPAMLMALYGALLDHQIADWTKVNGEGKRAAITPATVRARLPWLEGGMEVISQLTKLYVGPLLVPFDNSTSESIPPSDSATMTSSSPPGPQEPQSTSPSPAGKRPRRAR